MTMTFNSEPQTGDTSFADLFMDDQATEPEWYRLWVGNPEGSEGNDEESALVYDEASFETAVGFNGFIVT